MKKIEYWFVLFIAALVCLLMIPVSFADESAGSETPLLDTEVALNENTAESLNEETNAESFSPIEAQYDFSLLNGNWECEYRSVNGYVEPQTLRLKISNAGITTFENGLSAGEVNISHNLNDIWAPVSDRVAISFASGDFAIRMNQDSAENQYDITIPVMGFLSGDSAVISISGNELTYSDPEISRVRLIKIDSPAHSENTAAVNHSKAKVFTFAHAAILVIAAIGLILLAANLRRRRPKTESAPSGKKSVEKRNTIPGVMTPEKRTPEEPKFDRVHDKTEDSADHAGKTSEDKETVMKKISPSESDHLPKDAHSPDDSFDEESLFSSPTEI